MKRNNDALSDAEILIPCATIHGNRSEEITVWTYRTLFCES